MPDHGDCGLDLLVPHLPSISLVFLACIPILAIGCAVWPCSCIRCSSALFHTYDALNNVVDENLQGIRVVKSYNRESFEVSKFGRISQRIFKDFTKAERIMSFNSPLMMVCVYASMILIAWMGAQQIVASGNNAAVGLTTGDLTALVTYAMQILMAMMMLSMIFIMVIISQASAERICQVLQEESTVTDPANPVTDMADGSIEFDHVTFRYSDSSEKPVLDDINLKIRSGMTIGIVGGHRFRQVEPRAARAATVRRELRFAQGRWRGRARLRSGSPARPGVHGTAEERAVLRHHRRESQVGQPERHRRGRSAHAAQLAQADGFVQEFPDKYDTYIEQGAPTSPAASASACASPARC